MEVSWIAAMALLAAGVGAQAHDHHQAAARPYAGMERREIKALSAEEIEQLRSGAGMGLAMPAELNSYPGPKHVLELAEQLGLTNEQKTATTSVFDEMRARAVSLGEQIVEMESHLDRAFASGEIDDERLDRMTSHIAKLRGELRAAHLKAHLRMKEILTPEQVAQYDQLRGYARE